MECKGLRSVDRLKQKPRLSPGLNRMNRGREVKKGAFRKGQNTTGIGPKISVVANDPKGKNRSRRFSSGFNIFKKQKICQKMHCVKHPGKNHDYQPLVRINAGFSRAFFSGNPAKTGQYCHTCRQVGLKSFHTVEKSVEVRGPSESEGIVEGCKDPNGRSRPVGCGGILPAYAVVRKFPVRPALQEG